MKRTCLILAVAILACAPFVTAQTTGTISLSGSIPEAYSLTSSGGTQIVGATVALGALIPANNQTLVTDETVVGYLRSNHKYKLSAQVASLTRGTGSDDGGLAIQLSDIGFGIRGLVKNGAQVVNQATHAVVSGFDYTSAWPTPSGGLTPFDGTTYKNLGNITSDTQILGGQRISNKGNITTTDNAVQVTFGFAVLPQYFSPDTGFSTTITLTIATN
jgi:hypothetical protein